MLNIFSCVQKDDLFWTRDLDGFYWICRALNVAELKCNRSYDIGAIIPVEAYKYGLEVPCTIKNSFNRPKGGISHKIRDKRMIEYSKHIYNQESKEEYYEVNADINLTDFIDFLPPLDLEELVISYIQIKYGYYLLSNSIANRSTTVKVECELRSSDINNPVKAVVQVKSGNNESISFSTYSEYIINGYQVFLFAPKYEENNIPKNFIIITKENLLDFVKKYEPILPENIIKWTDIFHLVN